MFVRIRNWVMTAVYAGPVGDTRLMDGIRDGKIGRYILEISKKPYKKSRG